MVAPELQTAMAFLLDRRERITKLIVKLEDYHCRVTIRRGGIPAPLRCSASSTP